MNAIWTTKATINAIGGARVTLDFGGVTADLPVDLPSEERLLGERLYEPVVVAVLAASEARSAEEDLAWHRAEVTRLRGLLAAMETTGGVTRLHVELGPRKVCITAPTDAGEHAVNNALLAWAAERGLKNPEVAAELKALTERASIAEALAGLLACTLSLPQEGKRLGPGPCEALKKWGPGTEQQTPDADPEASES